MLLDYNNKLCVYNPLRIFNHEIIKIIFDKQLIYYNVNDVNENENSFIHSELTNHADKMKSSKNKKLSYLNTLKNFTKIYFDDVKIKIQYDESYGNNILYNLENSFSICFYLINEYITKTIYSDSFLLNKLKELLTIDTYDRTINYLSIIANNNKNDLYDNDIDLILNNYNKNDKASKYIELNINETDIIKAYTKIIDAKGYGVYSNLWNTLLTDEILKDSNDLSLIKILELSVDININNKNIEIIDIYFDYATKIAISYFESSKFTNINMHLLFIYDILIHLTKIVICFGIEIITRRIIFSHLKNVYIDYNDSDLNGVIDRLFQKNIELTNKTFIDILYTDLPELLVKNSVFIFKDTDDKNSFEIQSISEILQKVFDQLNSNIEVVILEDIIMDNLKINVANYFELFTTQTINSWYIICENTFKFIINHGRIFKTLKMFRN